MRLLAAFLWFVGTVLWLPWFAVVVRLAIDLFSGVPLSSSEYLNPAFIFIWPILGWTHWGIVSWWPAMALSAMAVTYLGWRFFWWEQDWRKTYSGPIVLFTILVPPCALWLLYRDARNRFLLRNSDLQHAVDEALEAIEPGPDIHVLN
jgi:hypothetical protein